MAVKFHLSKICHSSNFATRRQLPTLHMHKSTSDNNEDVLEFSSSSVLVQMLGFGFSALDTFFVLNFLAIWTLGNLIAYNLKWNKTYCAVSRRIWCNILENKFSCVDISLCFILFLGKGYKEIKDQLPESIEVACHNSADSCTLSGPDEDMKKYITELQKRGVFAKLVNVSNIAYHSRYIAPAAPALLRYLKEVSHVNSIFLKIKVEKMVKAKCVHLVSLWGLIGKFVEQHL